MRVKSVGFMGDSIFYGFMTPEKYQCWKIFEKLSSIPVISSYGENPLAFPGEGVFDLVKRFDSLFAKFNPSHVILSIGANNMDSDGSLKWPYGISEKSFMRSFSTLFKNFREKKISCIWAGLPPFEDGGRNQEKSLEWSFKIAEVAEKFSFQTISYTEALIKMKDWDAMGGPYYNNLRVDIHPNSLGQKFIGTFYAEKIRELK